MRWMILGGGGCFGLHLARHLVDSGHVVFGVGRSPWPGPAWTLGLENETAFDYAQEDIKENHLLQLMDDIRPAVIVNFAALAYSTSWENSAAYYDTNVTAVARITEWLTGRDWLHRFVQIGSSEVYGSTNFPADERASVHCSSPYAVSKLAADLHVLSLPKMPGMVIRPSNCYGEAQLLYRLIPRAIWCALNGRKLPLAGGGQAKKTWMHASDLARAVAAVVKHGRTHCIYNASSSYYISNAELMELIGLVTGTPVAEFVEPSPPRAHEDSSYRIGSSLIRALGWGPTTSLESGIKRCVSWMDTHMSEIGEPQQFVLRP